MNKKSKLNYTLLGAFILIYPCFVNAQYFTYVEANGLRLTCMARHANNGSMVAARGINGYAGGFWGYATYDQFGWPIIIFDTNQIKDLPQILIRYIYYHECAHLAIPTSNEITASCEGLKNMRRAGHVDARGEEAIGTLIRSIPNLLPQYGGSGAALWGATLQCAGA